MDKETANRLLYKWRSILGLQEWRIKLEHDTLPSDMALGEVAGESVWTESNKTATIRILREDCYGERIVPFSFEKTLIHELLHLKLCLLGESGNELQDRYVHQLIDDLARAFAEASYTDPVMTQHGDKGIDWEKLLGPLHHGEEVVGPPIPCAPGERFTWKGRSFVALGMEQGGMLAITEKPVFEEEPFDDGGSNDWHKSSLRRKLNGPFLEEIGKEDLLPFTSDLTSDDGLKDYGTAEDYVFLLSADLYRKYRPYIPNQETWWWLITPWTTHPSFANYVRYSRTDGSLSSSGANSTVGVVAGLLFNPESIQMGKDALRQQRGA